MPSSLNLDSTIVAKRYRILRSMSRVAGELHCSVATVRNYLDKAGIARVYGTGPRPHVVAFNRLPLDSGYISERYLDGATSYQLAQEMGCSVPTILTRLRGAGVAPRKHYKRTAAHMKKLHVGHARARKKGMGSGNCHPGWKGGINATACCKSCGSGIRLRKTEYRSFCNKKCEADYRSKTMRGKNAVGYKDGRCLDAAHVYFVVRGSRAMRLWRKAVFERDGRRCVDCDSREQLQVHHKKRFIDILREHKIRSLDDAEKCDALWDLKIGVTVCKDCHKKRDREQRRKAKAS